MSARILHVIATLDRGGTEVTALALAREFDRRGFDNRVAALEAGRGAIVEDFAAVAGMPIVLPAGRFARARALYSLIEGMKPDAMLLHIFNIEHVILGAAARLAGVRRLVTKAGNPVATDPGMARKVRIIVHLTNYLGIRVVSASRWIENSLAETGCVPWDMRLVHNGCDVEAIGTRADAARAGRVPKAVVGMVSRLDPIKDHATLLNAFARLPDTIRGRRTRLFIVGDGPLRFSLEKQAARLGIANRVTFGGARADIPEAVANFDVFAFATTRDEGFGVVLIEALAAGIPIVASDVPACREVLAGGSLGQLVPPGNPAALAEALHHVLLSPPVVPSRSEIARRYGVKSMADKHLGALFSPLR